MVLFNPSELAMKSVFALVALAAAAAVQPALAHYRFYKYIDPSGTVTGEYVYVRANTNANSPVSPLTILKTIN
jgi:hypothetical protein